MEELDLAKRDMTVTYGGRTFLLRAYRDGGTWQGIVIENKTPVRNSLPPAVDAASYYAAAVQFVAASIEASERAPVTQR
jgi:hypothetical protein